MRRILRKIAEDDYEELGDTSTLAEPGVVDDLISNRVQQKLFLIDQNNECAPLLCCSFGMGLFMVCDQFSAW